MVVKSGIFKIVFDFLCILNFYYSSEFAINNFFPYKAQAKHTKRLVEYKYNIISIPLTSR